MNLNKYWKWEELLSKNIQSKREAKKVMHENEKATLKHKLKLLGDIKERKKMPSNGSKMVISNK